MHRRLRLDIAEGQHMRILEHLLARDFAAQDLGEDVVAVVCHAHEPPKSYELRDFFSSMPERPWRASSARHTSAGATLPSAHSTSR